MARRLQGADGRIRGVVALDAIPPEEFGAAFRRWQPTMRRIGPEEVADVVLEAVRPDVIACGGYQSVRFTLRPKTVRHVARPRARGLGDVAIVDPMPLIL